MKLRFVDKDEWGWDFLGFTWSIERTEAGPWLWIRAEASGSPERAADFLQYFVQTFRPDVCLLLRCAIWSTSLELGGFGGGVALITDEEIKSFDDLLTAEQAGELPHERDSH